MKTLTNIFRKKSYGDFKWIYILYGDDTSNPIVTVTIPLQEAHFILFGVYTPVLC